jgi:hypothetical protein
MAHIYTVCGTQKLKSQNQVFKFTLYYNHSLYLIDAKASNKSKAIKVER